MSDTDPHKTTADTYGHKCPACGRWHPTKKACCEVEQSTDLVERVAKAMRPDCVKTLGRTCGEGCACAHDARMMLADLANAAGGAEALRFVIADIEAFAHPYDERVAEFLSALAEVGR